MKHGILSIILAVIGIYFTFLVNIEIAELVEKEIINLKHNSEINPAIFKSEIRNKLILLGIALIGMLFGVKSVKRKNKIGIIGIILSLVLIILIFIPLWQHILYDSSLDINFIN